MKLSEFEAYEQRKAAETLKATGSVLLIIALVVAIVLVAASPHRMKYGSFNKGIEDRVLAVLNEREDLGELQGMMLLENWSNGYRVSADTTLYNQLTVYFDWEWNIKTIRNNRLDQVYP